MTLPWPNHLQVKYLEDVGEYLQRVTSSIRKNNPDKPTNTTALPSKESLLQWQLPIRVKVDAWIQAELQKIRQGSLQPSSHKHQLGEIFSKSVSRQQHNMLLVDCLSGFLPPTRLSCIRSIKIPSAARSPCKDPDCDRPGCRGNRLELMENFYVPSINSLSSSKTSTQPVAVSSLFSKPMLPPPKLQKLKLILEHHKTSTNANQAIECELPEDLAKNVHSYLQHGHPTLTLETDCKMLFVSSMGQAMTEQCLWRLWLDLQKEWKAPWQPFEPRLLRHIHVTFEIQSMADAVAATNSSAHMEGGAHIMGNSTKVWAKSYCPQYGSIMAQAAIDKITKWRKELQAKA